MTEPAKMIMVLFQQLSRAGETNDRETCSCYGVTPVQGLTLVELGRGRPLSMQQLAERLKLSISTMSRVVDRLVAGKLVQRLQDPDDRRVVLTALTEEGLKVSRELDRCYQGFFERVVDKIPEKDLDGFMSGLRILADQMECCPPPGVANSSKED